MCWSGQCFLCSKNMMDGDLRKQCWQKSRPWIKKKKKNSSRSKRFEFNERLFNLSLKQKWIFLFSDLLCLHLFIYLHCFFMNVNDEHFSRLSGTLEDVQWLCNFFFSLSPARFFILFYFSPRSLSKKTAELDIVASVILYTWIRNSRNLQIFVNK